jgi:hypothetical protein
MTHTNLPRPSHPSGRGVLAFLARHPWAVAAVVLLALLGGAAVLLNRVAVRALERQIAAIRAAGEPLTLEELEARRPAIPDDENMALILAEAGERLRAYLDHLKTTEDGRLMVQRLPLVGRGRPDLPIGQRWPDETLEASRQFIAANAEVWELVRRAARLEAGRYALSLAPSPLETMLPHLAPHRRVCRSLGLKALVAAHESRGEEAVTAIERIARINRSLFGEPMLVSALTIQAGDATALHSALTIVNLCELAPDAAMRLIGCTAEMEGRPSMREAIVAERAAVYQTYLWLTTGGTIDRVVTHATQSVSGFFTLLYRVTPGLAAADVARSLRMYDVLLRELEQGLSPAKTAAQQLEQTAADTSVVLFLTKIMGAFPSRVFKFQIDYLQLARCTRAAMAAEGFRLLHGAWPDDLEALLPDWLDALPVDPVSGQPVRYRVDDMGILVWPQGDEPPPDAVVPHLGSRDWHRRPWAVRILNPPLRGMASVEDAAGAQTKE